MDVSKYDSAAEARLWVLENSVIVEEAFQRFLRDGEWPTVQSLQRYFDQREQEIDALIVANLKPLVPREARWPMAEHFSLNIRHLMWVENAKSLLNICVRAVQQGVRSYLSSEDDPPYVSSEDDLKSPYVMSDEERRRVYRLLTNESATLFGGSSMSGDHWKIDVDSRFVRYFREVRTVEDFVRCQDLVRLELAREASRFEVPIEGLRETIIPKGPESLLDNAITIQQQEQDEAMPVLFLSWGREKSKKVAKALVPVIEGRLPGVKIFFSPTSIDPGDNPLRKIFREGLLLSRALVVVLTEESASSAFVIWETASAWALEQLVIPIFVDIDPSRVPGPLTTEVQGVHLNERDGIDSAIRRLATHFGNESPTLLLDQEYESLQRSAEGIRHEGIEPIDPG